MNRDLNIKSTIRQILGVLISIMILMPFTVSSQTVTILKQLDVKNKLADKICIAFSLKNGCNAALESSVSKLFGILL